MRGLGSPRGPEFHTVALGVRERTPPGPGPATPDRKSVV